MIEQNPNVYIVCDKANSDKAGAKSATFPKMVALYDKEQENIYEFLVDCDAAGSSTEEGADGIEHSIKKLGFTSFQLNGQATDSGGGTTLQKLRRKLEEKGLTAIGYRVVSCSLHNIQTCLRQCIQKVYGEGEQVERVSECGKKTQDYKINAMQLLNGLYNLFKYLDLEEMKEIWKVSCEDLGKDNVKFKKLTNPVVTRWWLIGVTASEVDEDWDIWKQMMKGLVRMPKSKTAKGVNSSAIQDIAAANYNLMTMDEIQADIRFIANLHKYFVFPHFEHLQRGDPLTGDVAGYQGRMLPLRYFIMHTELSACENNEWKTMSEFDSYVSFLQNTTREIKERSEVKANHSFRIMKIFLRKHFAQWMNEHLPYGLFSPEQPVAQTVANFILGRAPLHPREEGDATRRKTCISTYHQSRYIDLCEFELFLHKECNTIELIRQTKDVIDHLPAIEMLAEGHQLWDQNAPLPPPLLSIQNYYLLNMSALPTSTHMIERAVKRANNCNVHGRSEKMRSVYATANTETVKNGTLIVKNKKEQNVIVRSKKRGEHLIKYVVNEHERMEKLNVSKEARIETKNKIMSNQNTFKKARTEATVKSFKENRNREIPSHRYEGRSGVDHTDLVSGRVPFCEMTKKNGHEQLMLDEIRARGIELTDEERRNYTKLIKRLKDHEGNNTSFKPVLPLDRFVWY